MKRAKQPGTKQEAGDEGVRGARQMLQVLDAMADRDFREFCEWALDRIGLRKVSLAPGDAGQVRGTGTLPGPDGGLRVAIRFLRGDRRVSEGDLRMLREAGGPSTDRGLIVTTGAVDGDVRLCATVPGVLPVLLVDGEQFVDQLRPHGLHGIISEMNARPPTGPELERLRRELGDDRTDRLIDLARPTQADEADDLEKTVREHVEWVRDWADGNRPLDLSVVKRLDATLVGLLAGFDQLSTESRRLVRAVIVYATDTSEGFGVDVLNDAVEVVNAVCEVLGRPGMPSDLRA